MLWLFWACHSGSAVADKYAKEPFFDKEGVLSISGDISWFYWGGTEQPIASFIPVVFLLLVLSTL